MVAMANPDAARGLLGRRSECETLDGLLQSVRSGQSEVLVLRELNGLSYQEISDVLNVPAGTVESRIFRARQELKELLKDYLE